MTHTVGIIANPASGKDIRRLVAQAATVSDQAKVSIVAQAIIGLGAAGVEQVLVMPDRQEIGQRAIRRLRGRGMDDLPAVQVLAMPVNADTTDSRQAAEQMRRQGAGCILVLGGDGTARAASLGAGEVPLLAISTGTNNVLPHFIEGTVAGIAAATVALGIATREMVCYRAKRLVLILNSEFLDIALVDAALLDGRFVGSRAVWSTASLRHVWVTRADPQAVGLTSVALTQGPLGPRDALGRWIEVAAARPGDPLAILGPGLIEPIGVAGSHTLWPECPIELTLEEPAILSLDGEREHALNPGDRLRVTLRLDGPWLVEPDKAMRVWTERAKAEVT